MTYTKHVLVVIVRLQLLATTQQSWAAGPEVLGHDVTLAITFFRGTRVSFILLFSSFRYDELNSYDY